VTPLLVDRNGEVWRPAGVAADGDVVLACDSPSNPDDRGDGPSYPWTLSQVEKRFGPLVQATVDAEMAQVAAVDVTLHEVFGRDESTWLPGQTADYLAAIGDVHARFHPEFRVVA